MDYLHSIALFYYRVVLTPKYRPVQVVNDDCPSRHG